MSIIDYIAREDKEDGGRFTVNALDRLNDSESGFMENFQIRYATTMDVSLALEFIKELAKYEKLLDEVIVTPDLLREWLFENKKAEVLIGEMGEKPVAFALFFHNFSTFLGRAGIYLEDLYVRPEARGKGIGKAMFQYIARLTVQRGCGRLEWSCLDWNANSISFYESFDAEAMRDWTIYRLTGNTLIEFAEAANGIIPAPNNLNRPTSPLSWQ